MIVVDVARLGVSARKLGSLVISAADVRSVELVTVGVER